MGKTGANKDFILHQFGVFGEIWVYDFCFYFHPSRDIHTYIHIDIYIYIYIYSHKIGD
jgi:hypothetical protein